MEMYDLFVVLENFCNDRFRACPFPKDGKIKKNMNEQVVRDIIHERNLYLF